MQTERRVNTERYVNAWWTQDERFIRSASRIILTLRNQEKITKKLHCTCAVLLLWKLKKQSYPISCIMHSILQTISILSYPSPFIFRYKRKIKKPNEKLYIIHVKMKISYKFISSNIFRTNLCIRNIISYAGGTQLCKQTGKRIHVCFHKIY